MPHPDLEAEFIQGNHAKIVADFFDVPVQPTDADDIIYVTGSLAFVGRLAEAEVLFEGQQGSLPEDLQFAMRFFMATGWSRSCEFEKAQIYLREQVKNRKKAGPKELFFLYQGLGFYHFMSCRYRLALNYAKKATLQALKAQFFYGRALAMDLQGHCQIAYGEIFQGLEVLERAHHYFTILGNCGNARAIARSLVCYRARYSLRLEENLPAIQQLISEAEREENNYSLASSYLDLARIYGVMGQVQEADDTLKKAAAVIQRSSLEQFSALLDFRRAHCAYLRGNWEKARNYLQGIQHIGVHSQDLRTRLQVLGLQIAIDQAQSRPIDPDALALRRHLSLRSQYHIGMRILRRDESRDSVAWGKDPIGDLIDEILDPNMAIEERAELILKSGFHSLFYHLVDVDRSAKVLYLNLLPGLILILNQGDVLVQKLSSSSQLMKLIPMLARLDASKKMLIEQLWGYDYSPLRHDPLIYGLFSRLRGLLGPCQDWVESIEDGYCLRSDIKVKTHAHQNLEPRRPEQTAAPEESGLAEQLNYRQLKILRLLDQQESINLKLCQDIFEGVSKVTLSRDLSALADAKLLVRSGKGRNTSYLKAAQLSLNLEQLEQ